MARVGWKVDWLGRGGGGGGGGGGAHRMTAGCGYQ